MSADAGDDATPLGALPDDDPTAVVLRRALAAEAALVRPRPDGLQAIRARTGGLPAVDRHPPAEPVTPRPGRARRGVLLGVAAAGLVAAGLGGGALVGSTMDPDAPPAPIAAPQRTTTATPPPSPPATTAPPTDAALAVDEAPVPTTLASVKVSAAATSTTTASVPVYFVGASTTRLALYREFLPPLPGGGDRVEQAVRTMLAARPLDPDYGNAWHDAPVRVVSADDTGITLDLGSQAFTSEDRSVLDGVEFTGALAALRYDSVQQLVWTATAAYGRSVPVTVLVDGRSGVRAWDEVPLGAPMTRAVGVRAPVWVIDPQQDQQLRGPGLQFSGVGPGADAALRWTLAGPDGDERSGAVTTDGNGEYRVTEGDLAAGTWTLTVTAPDVQGGGPATTPRPFSDTKTFTVTAP